MILRGSSEEVLNKRGVIGMSEKSGLYFRVNFDTPQVIFCLSESES